MPEEFFVFLQADSSADMLPRAQPHWPPNHSGAQIVRFGATLIDRRESFLEPNDVRKPHGFCTPASFARRRPPASAQHAVAFV